ncbi:MAG: lytic transglycosylase domain-containing protein [Patescibacteria group bacterium]|nr:lytic transglycosylase domain-containing protein [Patescibacteria group bacterium]
MKQVESKGNRLAVSPAGAQGPYQFMPETAQQYGVDPFHEGQAREGARRYLTDLYNKTGSLEKALMAYNWGPGNLDKYGAGKAPKETRDYVKKVLEERENTVEGEWEDAPSGKKKTAPIARPLSQDNKPPQRESTLSKTAKEAALNLGMDTAGLVDMLLGSGGQIAGVLADSGRRLYGAITGEPRRESAEAGAALQGVAGAWNTPVQSALAETMRLLGYPETAGRFEKSDVNRVMKKIGKGIEAAGTGAERVTGSAVLKEDVQSTTNAFLAFLGAKGLGVTGEAAAARFAKTEVPKPTESAPTGMGEIAPSLRGKPVVEAPAVKAPVSGMPSDSRINADLKANDLMQRGASLREAGAAVKKNPFVGESMEALRQGRASAKESFLRAIQGEFLGKEAQPTPALSGERLGIKDLSFKKELGEADPRVLAGIAGAAIGALYDRDDPILGGIVGLSAGYLLARGLGASTLQSKNFAKLGEEFYKPDYSKIETPRELARTLHILPATSTADVLILEQTRQAAGNAGVTPQMDRVFRDFSEGSISKLTPAQEALRQRWVVPLQEVMASELNKIREPGERAAVAGELQTRLAKNHAAWWEALATQEEGISKGTGGAGRGVGGKPSALKSRTVFALQDGTIITTKPLGKGDYRVTGWKNGNPMDLGVSSNPIKKGSTFKGAKVSQAKQLDIEKNTPIKYVDSELATLSVKTAELLRYNRAKDMLNGILESPLGKSMFTKDAGEAARQGWVRPEGIERLPAMRDVYMPKEFAEVFTDFLKSNRVTPALLEGGLNLMLRSMFINPLPHIHNEFIHWVQERGIGGFISPTGLSGASKGLYGLMKTLPESIRSVVSFDKTQVEMMHNGAFLMNPNIRAQKAWTSIFQEGLKEAVFTGSFREMAKAFGVAPVALAKRLSDNMQNVMWGMRDIFYTQIYLEQKGLIGRTPQEALKQAGHMPEYYIPSRVGFRGEAGRAVSQLLQNRTINIFSYYHYGMIKEAKSIAKEMLNYKDKPEMLMGIDRAAMLVAGMAVLYPQIDKVLSWLLDEDVKSRRPGMYHVVDTAIDVYNGEKSPASLSVSLMTPNPVTTGVFELIDNRYLYSGQPITYPGTSPEVKALDYARFAGSHFAPAQAQQRMMEGGLTARDYMLSQLDIVSQESDKAKRQKKIRAMLEKQGRKHEAKMRRAYGLED